MFLDRKICAMEICAMKKCAILRDDCRFSIISMLSNFLVVNNYIPSCHCCNNPFFYCLLLEIGMQSLLLGDYYSALCLQDWLYSNSNI